MVDIRMTTRVIITVVFFFCFSIYTPQQVTVVLIWPRVRPLGNEYLNPCHCVARAFHGSPEASSPLLRLSPSHLLDPLHLPYQPTTPKHAQRIMEGAEKSDKASPPLQIDPKWYIVRRATSLESLTAHRIQPPRRSQILLPTHQDR